MKGGALVSKRDLTTSNCGLLVANAKSTEVVASLGKRFAEKTENNAANRLVVDGDVKVDTVRDMLLGRGLASTSRHDDNSV